MPRPRRLVPALLLLALTACPRGPSPEEQALARYHAGLAKMRESDFQQAVLELQKAHELDPKLAAVDHSLGEAWLGLMRGADAEASFRRALALEPDKYLSWMGLGHALRMEGRKDDAMGAFRKAAGLEPKEPQPHRYLGDLLFEAGKTKEALAEYDAAARLGGSAGLDALLRLAELFEHAGRHDEAARAYARAITACEAEAARWEKRAEHFEGREKDVAKKARERREDLLARAVELRQTLGDVEARAGRLQAAREAYRAALKARPDDPMGWQLLGTVDAALGAHDEAVADYERAMKLAPGSARVWEGLGRLRLAAGRTKEAREAAQKALADDALAGDPVLVRAVADLLSKVGEHLQSGELYRMLLRDEEGDAGLWLAFAREEGALGRSDEVHRACGKLRATKGGAPPEALAFCGRQGG